MKYSKMYNPVQNAQSIGMGVSGMLGLPMADVAVQLDMSLKERGMRVRLSWGGY